jgi:hypothetical protein
MDVEQVWSHRVKESEIARVLTLIAEQPNRRERSKAGDQPGAFDFWFDGGAARCITGWTEYDFGDGTRATVGITPVLSVQIKFPNGATVEIRQAIDRAMRPDHEDSPKA